MNLRIYLTIAILTISTIVSGQATSLFKIVENGKTGYINETGIVVIEAKFLSGNDFSDGLASVRLDGRYGYIDKTGAFVIQPKYDVAYNFIQGIASVYINGEPFFINKEGKIVLDTIYRAIHFVGNNIGIVQTKTRNVGIIDILAKKLIVDTQFQSILPFQNGIAIVTKRIGRPEVGFDDEYALIDPLGNFIVDFGKFKVINPYNEGFATVEIKDVKNKGKIIDGVIDTLGNLLFQRPQVNNCFIGQNFHNGLAIMSLYKYWIPEENGVLYSSAKQYEGYINLKGEIVLNDTLNHYLKSFANNRTFLEISDGKYKIVDTKFKTIGNDTFTRIKDDGFNSGFAIVEFKGDWGIIDTNGVFVVKPEYEKISEISVQDNCFFYRVEINDDEQYYGISSLKGEKIIAPIIQDFDHSGFVNGLLRTLINDRLTYIDKTGNIVWQERKETNKTLKPLNIDFMNRGYFYAYSKPDEDDLGGFGGSENIPLKITTQNFPKNKVSIIVNQNSQDTIQNMYIGYKVFVANNSNEDLGFNAQDSRLYMKVQALNEVGLWKDIEYLPSSWCGNSYHLLTLAKNNYWTFLTPKYEGEIKTKLRIELQYIDPKDKTAERRDRKEITIYSNEFEGSINPGQFWNKREYYQNGIMDPYND